MSEAVRAEVRAGELDRVAAAIARLSARGERLGTGPLELRVLGRDGERASVELRGSAPALAGWHVAGRIRHRPDGAENEVEVVPGESVERWRWRRAEAWCEHCGVARRRSETYLVRRGRGPLHQVGTSCVADFTGDDLRRALRQAELLARARGELRAAAPPAGEFETTSTRRSSSTWRP